MRRIVIVLVLFLAAPCLAETAPGRGVALFQSRDWAGAKAEFAGAVQRNDRDAQAHYYLGRLALIEDDADVAAEQLRRAVELDDAVSDYHLWYGKAIMLQGMRAMNPLAAMGGKTQLERALSLDDRNLDARDALVDVYSMAPAMMGGSTDKAREQAEAIARIDAMRGHLALGRIAMRAKDSTAVERELNAAITLKPDTLPAYSALANWYAGEKESARAFATLDRYLERRKDDAYALIAVGRVSATTGEQLDRGERALRAFIARPPRDAAHPVLAVAWSRLGQILNHEGKSTEARAAYRRALELDAHNDDARKALQ